MDTYHVYTRKELATLLTALMAEATASQRYAYNAADPLCQATIYLSTKGHSAVEGDRFSWCKYRVNLTLDTLERMLRRVNASPNSAYRAKKKSGVRLERLAGLK